MAALPHTQAGSGRLRSLAKSASIRYQKLSLYGKAAICSILLFYLCLIAVIAWATPSGIAQFMYDLAVEIRRLPYGHLVLIAVIVLISFPPFIGHSTLMNVCGFTYGMQGFIPAAISTVGGSALVFVILRSLFSDRLRKWTAANEAWGAFEAIIVSTLARVAVLVPFYIHSAEQRAKGLPLIILVRISPFLPWVYSNSLFAGIQPVSLTQFVFATLFVLPRVAIYVFVGSRIASLSDGEQRNHMGTMTKFINASLIVGGIVITAISGWVIYYLVEREIRSLRRHSTTDELGPASVEDAEEGAALLAQS